MKQQKRAHSTRKSKFVAGASTGPTGVNAPLYNYITIVKKYALNSPQYLDRAKDWSSGLRRNHRVSRRECCLAALGSNKIT